MRSHFRLHGIPENDPSRARLGSVWLRRHTLFLISVFPVHKSSHSISARRSCALEIPRLHTANSRHPCPTEAFRSIESRRQFQATMEVRALLPSSGVSRPRTWWKKTRESARTESLRHRLDWDTHRRSAVALEKVPFSRQSIVVWQFR